MVAIGRNPQLSHGVRSSLQREKDDNITIAVSVTKLEPWRIQSLNAPSRGLQADQFIEIAAPEPGRFLGRGRANLRIHAPSLDLMGNRLRSPRPGIPAGR